MRMELCSLMVVASLLCTGALAGGFTGTAGTNTVDIALPGVVSFAPAWAAGDYVVGQVVRASGAFHVCVTAGTSAVEPSGNAYVDGAGAAWRVCLKDRRTGAMIQNVSETGLLLVYLVTGEPVYLYAGQTIHFGPSSGLAGSVRVAADEGEVPYRAVEW